MSETHNLWMGKKSVECKQTGEWFTKRRICLKLSQNFRLVVFLWTKELNSVCRFYRRVFLRPSPKHMDRKKDSSDFIFYFFAQQNIVQRLEKLNDYWWTKHTCGADVHLPTRLKTIWESLRLRMGKKAALVDAITGQKYFGKKKSQGISEKQ